MAQAAGGDVAGDINSTFHMHTGQYLAAGCATVGREERGGLVQEDARATGEKLGEMVVSVGNGFAKRKASVAWGNLFHPRGLLSRTKAAELHPLTNV